MILETKYASGKNTVRYKKNTGSQSKATKSTTLLYFEIEILF